MPASQKANMATNLKQNLGLISLVVVYWSIAFLGSWAWLGVSSETVRIVLGVTLFAFALVHGVKRYGWNTMLMWFGITFFISWAAEALSIAMGFPFGGYHYTDLLGVKIGPVPLPIMPAYFMTGYLAWTMATTFFGNLSTGIEKRNLVLLPFVASFIMVMWDFCFDPIKSTIERAWIWEEGGAYHGVPVTNYLGWFLTVFLIYLTFALYLYRFGASQRVEQSRTYWVLAPVMYLGVALEFLVYPFSKSSNMEIYWSIFLGTIFTMVFVSILNIILVSRMDGECFGAKPRGEG